MDQSRNYRNQAPAGHMLSGSRRLTHPPRLAIHPATTPFLQSTALQAFSDIPQSTPFDQSHAEFTFNSQWANQERPFTQPSTKSFGSFNSNALPQNQTSSPYDSSPGPSPSTLQPYRSHSSSELPNHQTYDMGQINAGRSTDSLSEQFNAQFYSHFTEPLESDHPARDSRLLRTPSNKRPRRDGFTDMTSPRSEQQRLQISQTSDLEFFGEMNEDTMPLCSLWQHANQKAKPSDADIQSFNVICNDSTENIKVAFENLRQPVQGLRTTPDPYTLSAYKIWKRNHPQEPLSKAVLNTLSLLFHAPYDTLCKWRTRISGSGQAPLSISENPSRPDSNLSTRCNSPSEWLTNTASRRNCRKVENTDPKKTKHWICLNCGEMFSDSATWKRHLFNYYRPEEFVCDECLSGGAEKSNRTWPRKVDCIVHMKDRHPDKPLSLRLDIHPDNYPKECYFRNCKRDQPFQNFDQAMKHIAKCMKDKAWKYEDFRFADLSADKEDAFGFGDGSGGGGSGGSSNSDDPNHDPGSGGSGGVGGSGNQGWLPSSKQPPYSSSDSFLNSSTTYGVNGNFSYSSVMTHTTQSAVGSSQDPGLSKRQKLSILSISSLWSSGLAYVGHLGTGGRSVIHEVRIRGELYTMALKILQSHLPESKHELSREIASLARIKQHPHIIKLITSYHNLSAMLFEPVADYDLSAYLRTYGATFDERRNLWLWFSCLASGLQHIHDQGVTHRDIKPSNILVKDRNVLFTDFGSSSTIDEHHREAQATHYTKLYAAPEVFQGHGGTKADIFSLGCVFLEMLTALISKDMWRDLQALQARTYHKEISSGHWAKDWNDHLSQSAGLKVAERSIQVLILVCGKMISPEPRDRPSAARLDGQLNPQLLHHCKYRKSLTWPEGVDSVRKRRLTGNSFDAFPRKRQSVQVTNEDNLTDATARLSLKDDLPKVPEVDCKGIRTSSETDSSSKNLNSISTYLRNKDPREKFRVQGKTFAAFLDRQRKKRFVASKHEQQYPYTPPKTAGAPKSNFDISTRIRKSPPAATSSQLQDYWVLRDQFNFSSILPSFSIFDRAYPLEMLSPTHFY